MIIIEHLLIYRMHLIFRSEVTFVFKNDVRGGTFEKIVFQVRITLLMK